MTGGSWAGVREGVGGWLRPPPHQPPAQLTPASSGRGLGPWQLGLCSGPMLIFYLFESGTGSGFKVSLK